ncbi:MAG: peptidylprolyl isomerase [Pseudomonadota bacterium]
MRFSGYAILVLVAGLVWTLSVAEAQTGYREQIAATVNDDVITMTDIKTRLKLNTGGRPVPESERDRAYQAILDELITETLQKQEARSLNIDVEDEQVEQAFANLAKQNKTSAAEFAERIESAGLPVEALHEKLETNIAWSQVVRRKLRPQVTISERDIDAVFEDIKRSGDQPRYRAAEIFLRSGEGKDDAEIEAKIKKLANEVAKGAPFSAVAQKHSEAPGASRGGDLGWMTLDQFEPHYRSVVPDMEKGQMVPMIKSDQGYHILFLIDRKMPETEKAGDTADETPAKTTSAAQSVAEVPGSTNIQPDADLPAEADKDEAAREEIANKLGMQRLDALQRRYLQDLKSAAFIDRRL